MVSKCRGYCYRKFDTKAKVSPTSKIASKALSSKNSLAQNLFNKNIYVIDRTSDSAFNNES